MDFKEYYKERLNEGDPMKVSGSEAARYRAERGLPSPKTTENLGSSAYERPEERDLVALARSRERRAARAEAEDSGKRPVDYKEPYRESREEVVARRERERLALEFASEYDKRIKTTTSNLLNAVHYYSRNFGVNLTPEHIHGIDFSQGSLGNHIDQISSRLPPIR